MERNSVMESVNNPKRLRIMSIQFGVDGMDVTYTDENMKGRIVSSILTSGIDFHADLGEEVSGAIMDIVETTRELIELAHKREVGVPDVLYTGRVGNEDVSE